MTPVSAARNLILAWPAATRPRPLQIDLLKGPAPPFSIVASQNVLDVAWWLQ
jgi:hypothetical protein